jgi:tetratricopeptide (TPR) repeat protein
MNKTVSATRIIISRFVVNTILPGLLFSFLFCASDPIKAKYSNDQITNANYYFMRGLELHEKGNPSAAIPFYNQSLKIIPEHSQANYNMGMIHKDAKEYDIALKYFIESEKNSKGDANLYGNMAFCYLELRKFGMMSERLNKARLIKDKDSKKSTYAFNLLRALQISIPSVDSPLMMKEYAQNRLKSAENFYNIIMTDNDVLLKTEKKSISLISTNKDDLIRYLGAPDVEKQIKDFLFLYWDQYGIQAVIDKNNRNDFSIFLNKTSVQSDYLEGSVNSYFRGSVNVDGYEITNKTMLADAERNIRNINLSIDDVSVDFIKFTSTYSIRFIPDADGYLVKVAFLLNKK